MSEGKKKHPSESQVSKSGSDKGNQPMTAVQCRTLNVNFVKEECAVMVNDKEPPANKKREKSSTKTPPKEKVNSDQIKKKITPYREMKEPLRSEIEGVGKTPTSHFRRTKVYV